MVWVGDFVHAGAKYEEANTFTSTQARRHVARDRTFLCSVNEED
jgi:hypothetical protein